MTVLANHKVVIGVPIFNEIRHIRESLESLAAQTYGNFVVLISDNASDDGSSDVCQAFAAHDDRFHYLRQAGNIGAAKNCEFLLESTRSEYFMWFGAHDLLDPTYLDTQVRVLDAHPDVALAYSAHVKIDEVGRRLRVHDGGDFGPIGRTGLQRYLQTVRGVRGDCTAVNALFRRGALSGIRFPRIAGVDNLILTRAHFFGRFARTNDAIYLRREFAHERDAGYMQRITGDATMAEPVVQSLWPLYFVLIRDYWALPVPTHTKLINFPVLLLYLELGYHNFWRVLRRALPAPVLTALKRVVRRGSARG